MHIDRYSVLGWCNGGCTALFLAASRRSAGRVRKVVVWSTNAYVTARDVAFYDSLRVLERWPPNQRRSKEDKYGIPYFRHTWNAWVDWNQSLLEQSATGEIISTQELTNIDVPTLVLHGAQDTLVPPQHALHLHRNIRTSS